VICQTTLASIANAVAKRITATVLNEVMA